MTLGQVKSSPNFCSFGPQRAEKHNIWRRKNTNLNFNSGLCTWIISSPIDGIVGPSPDYPVGEDLLLWCQFAAYALSPLFFEVTSGEGEAEWPLSCVCALIHGFANCIWNLTYFHCWFKKLVGGIALRLLSKINHLSLLTHKLHEVAEYDWDGHVEQVHQFIHMASPWNQIWMWLFLFWSNF